MIYDTQVVERREKCRCEGHSIDSRAETFYISQSEKKLFPQNAEWKDILQPDRRGKTIYVKHVSARRLNSEG
jgi:hypothetical protein